MSCVLLMRFLIYYDCLPSRGFDFVLLCVIYLLVVCLGLLAFIALCAAKSNSCFLTGLYELG